MRVRVGLTSLGGQRSSERLHVEVRQLRDEDTESHKASQVEVD